MTNKIIFIFMALFGYPLIAAGLLHIGLIDELTAIVLVFVAVFVHITFGKSRENNIFNE